MGKLINSDDLIYDLIMSFQLNSKEEFEQRYPFRVIAKIIDRQQDNYAIVERHGHRIHISREVRKNGRFGPKVVNEYIRCSRCNADFNAGTILNYCNVCGAKLDEPDEFEKDGEAVCESLGGTYFE